LEGVAYAGVALRLISPDTRLSERNKSCTRLQLRPERGVKPHDKVIVVRFLGRGESEAA
jgi:hypothetical protein